MISSKTGCVFGLISTSSKSGAAYLSSPQSLDNNTDTHQAALFERLFPVRSADSGRQSGITEMFLLIHPKVSEGVLRFVFIMCHGGLDKTTHCSIKPPSQ